MALVARRSPCCFGRRNGGRDSQTSRSGQRFRPPSVNTALVYGRRRIAPEYRRTKQRGREPRGCFVRDRSSEDRARKIGVHGAEVFAEGFGLGIGAGGGGDAFAEETADVEVEGEQVGEIVALDGEGRDVGEERLQALDGEPLAQEGERGRRARPDAEVGVA